MGSVVRAAARAALPLASESRTGAGSERRLAILRVALRACVGLRRQTLHQATRDVAIEQGPPATRASWRELGGSCDAGRVAIRVGIAEAARGAVSGGLADARGENRLVG